MTINPRIKPIFKLYYGRNLIQTWAKGDRIYSFLLPVNNNKTPKRYTLKGKGKIWMSGYVNVNNGLSYNLGSHPIIVQ